LFRLARLAEESSLAANTLFAALRPSPPRLAGSDSALGGCPESRSGVGSRDGTFSRRQIDDELEHFHQRVTCVDQLLGRYRPILASQAHEGLEHRIRMTHEG
jgi:hypothetical protein